MIRCKVIPLDPSAVVERRRQHGNDAGKRARGISVRVRPVQSDAPIELHTEARLVERRNLHAPIDRYRFSKKLRMYIGTTSVASGCIIRNSANGLL